jgi:hypothetical protein
LSNFEEKGLPQGKKRKAFQAPEVSLFFLCKNKEMRNKQVYSESIHNTDKCKKY